MCTVCLRNPTVRTFRTTFRMNVKSSLMQPSSLSNCEPDDDIHLFNSDTNDLSGNQFEGEESSSSSYSSLSLSSIDQELEELHCQITLEHCSNSYFAGYLSKKCYDKFKCVNCANIITQPDDNNFKEEEFLIFCRNYDSSSNGLFLKRPSSCFTEFVSMAQKIIKKTAEKMPEKKKIRKFICNKIKNENNICIFSEPCQDHYTYIIEHLVNCKLLRDFNWKSKNFKTKRAEKAKSKLNILKNN